MNLEQYVSKKYKNQSGWFIEEVADITNQQCINDVIANKDYLEGKHDILKTPNYVFNGEVVESRRIVLQTAKTLLQFQVEYLLANPVQITGNEAMSDTFSMVNKMGRYDFINKEILDKILKFGSVAEYVYLDKGKIKSKVLDPSQFTAIYDRHNELIGVIEHYVYDGIESYVVYSEDVVQEFDNENGGMVLRSQFANLSGLPIVYSSADEYGSVEGRSVLEDWKGILDNMERLLSKSMDATYKSINGIPVITGQQLKGQLPVDIVGGGIQLDDGSSFSFASNTTDIESFKVLYEALNKDLLNISMTPAISMNTMEISNVSTESIRILFSLANVRASLNEGYLKKGLYERYEKIRNILEYRGITMTDDEFYSLSFVFTVDEPSNETELLANLKVQRELGALSMESLLERSPYVQDVAQELARLDAEGSGNRIEDETLVR